MINFETQLNTIKHFYGFKFTLGGIFSIKGSDFEKIKGFPNFWSWGFEDKCINNRALENKIYIDRKDMYEIGNQNIIHIMDNPNKIISKKDCWRIDENSDNIDNINNLDYYILDEIYTNFYIIIMYNMKISIFGYKCRFEIIIICIILGMFIGISLSVYKDG